TARSLTSSCRWSSTAGRPRPSGSPAPPPTSSAPATRATGSRCSPTPTAELPLLEEGPGVGQPQRAAELRPVDGRLTAGAGQVRAHDPGRGPSGGHEDVLELSAQADRVERGADPGDRELALPVLVRRAGVRLVGIGDAAEVGDGRLPETQRRELIVLGVA